MRKLFSGVSCNFLANFLVGVRSNIMWLTFSSLFMEFVRFFQLESLKMEKFVPQPFQGTKITWRTKKSSKLTTNQLTFPFKLWRQSIRLLSHHLFISKSIFIVLRVQNEAKKIIKIYCNILLLLSFVIKITKFYVSHINANNFEIDIKTVFNVGFEARFVGKIDFF